MTYRRFFKILYLLLILGFFSALIYFWPKLSQPRIIEFKKSFQEFAAKNFPHFTQKEKNNSPPINFLLLGAPGEGWDAPDLTDTILVASFDPKQNRIFLFSLPRDLLVKIPGRNAWTKINALYAYHKNLPNQEFSALKEVVQEITGLKIDHYIFVDLALVKQTVDLLDGVNVLVEKDILDTSYPGPNHSYETFEIKAGWRYLDGETALKYIRSRQSTSDFDRIARQQQILQAIKQKVLTLKIYDFNTFLNLYQEFSRHIKTDMSLWQIGLLWQQIKNIPGQNIIRQEINPHTFFISTKIPLGQNLAYVLIPRAGQDNYEEIKNYIKDFFNLNNN